MEAERQLLRADTPLQALIPLSLDTGQLPGWELCRAEVWLFLLINVRMHSPEPCHSLGAALVAVGLAIKLKQFAAQETHPPELLLTKARSALQTFSHPSHSSLPPTPSPFRSQRPHSALSIDLSSLSRCSSALRLETDRINRMNSHCQALERKSQCLELKSIRQSQQSQTYREDTERREGTYRAEIAFRQRQLDAEKRSKETEKTAKWANWQDFSALKKQQKAAETAIRLDELSRSAAKLGLSKYSKQKAEEEKRAARLEKAQQWRDFVEAKKKVQREERENYGETRQKELTFNLRQAVSRNQEILTQMRKSGY